MGKIVLHQSIPVHFISYTYYIVMISKHNPGQFFCCQNDLFEQVWWQVLCLFVTSLCTCTLDTDCSNFTASAYCLIKIQIWVARHIVSKSTNESITSPLETLNSELCDIAPMSMLLHISKTMYDYQLCSMTFCKSKCSVLIIMIYKIFIEYWKCYYTNLH